MATSKLKQISIGLVSYQSGDGSPDHIANIGTIYIDNLTGNAYKYNGSSWHYVLTEVSNVNVLINGNLTVTGNTSLQSLSATSIFSGSTNLNDYFNQDRAQINTKVNRSGDTFTGHVNVPSLSAVTFSANTVNIIGNNDVTELTIKANSSQTQPLIRLLKSDDTELLRLHSNVLDNVFLGFSAGTSITSGLYNTFLGSSAGSGNTTGGVNVFVGHQAGSVITGGSSNVFVGAGAGKIKTSGDYNVYLGANAGGNTSVGDNNVYIGDWSGRFNYSGANNTYIGQASGYLSSGSGNVFIGKLAGMSVSGSNLLYISNSATPNPLIFGDFSTSQVKINGGLSANSVSATTISGGTIFSGSTNLYSIFATIPDQNDVTRVQPGTNTYTGGTANNPTINVSALTVNTIIASGNTSLQGITATTFSATTISASTGAIQGSLYLNDDIDLLSNPDLQINSIYNQRVILHDNNTSSNWFLHTQAFGGGEGYGNFGIGTSSNNANNFFTISTAGTVSFKSSLVTGFTIYNTGGTVAFRVNTLNRRTGINTAQPREDFEVSGKTLVQQLSATTITATTISGGTLYSGSTDLYSIFLTSGAVVPTYIQPGTNTYTGGTATLPTVNVSALTINTITASGSSTFTGGLSANTLSGGTILSGSTNLYSIFATIPDQNDVTRVQPGTNTYTGGTDNNPTINVSALTINTLIVSGSSQLASTTATSISGGTISGGTLFSGSTNLYNIFQAQTGVLKQKNGSVTGSTFSGNPKKATVTFGTAFPDNNYAVTITGEIDRTWTIESKTSAGFTINANANAGFSSSNVFWMAGQIGESN